MPELSAFLPAYSSTEFKGVVEAVKSDPGLLRWYFTGRLLNPKQVNLFAGTVRSYRQFMSDVKRRAAQTESPLEAQAERFDVKNVIRVLDLCTKLNGNTSNVLTDYFTDNDEYAEYLAKFVDFEGKTAAYLSAFCNERRENGELVGIYYDGGNPILNRNVVWAKMYGAADVISGAIPRVDIHKIQEYYKTEKEIEAYRQTMTKAVTQTVITCRTQADQMSLKRFQELKNRIELRDIVEYSELLDELQGQMINWAYLRERDLMYFQMGFHYACLHNDSAKPEGYCRFTKDDIDLDEAVLYQIAALYTCGLPVYYFDDVKKKLIKKGQTAATSIKINEYFSNYTKNCLGIRTGEKDSLREYSFYEAGLELFENVKEHTDIVKLRNYIDHFSFYTKMDRSMLDLYGEVFDRFFTYDLKYQKNVSNMLSNILLDHFVIPRFSFESGVKSIGEEKKECAAIQLDRKNALQSDMMTYTIGKGKEELPAKSVEFLRNIYRLLNYCEGNTAEPSDEVFEDAIEKEKRAAEDRRLVEDEKSAKDGKFAGNNKSAENNRPMRNDKNAQGNRNSRGDQNRSGKGHGNFNNAFASAFNKIDLSSLPKG